jgi:hypothetical protein
VSLQDLLEIFFYLLDICNAHEVGLHMIVVTQSPIVTLAGDTMPDMEGGSLFVGNISNFFRPYTKI